MAQQKLHRKCVTGSKCSHGRCSIKKAILKNFAIFKGKQTPELESLFNKFTGLEVSNLFWKETPTQLFSFEYCEILKNTWRAFANGCFGGPLNPLHVSFYTAWKHQKMKASDIFSGCTRKAMAQNGLIHHRTKAKKYLSTFL